MTMAVFWTLVWIELHRFLPHFAFSHLADSTECLTVSVVSGKLSSLHRSNVRQNDWNACCKISSFSTVLLLTRRPLYLLDRIVYLRKSQKSCLRKVETEMSRGARTRSRTVKDVFAAYVRFISWVPQHETYFCPTLKYGNCPFVGANQNRRLSAYYAITLLQNYNIFFAFDTAPKYM